MYNVIGLVQYKGWCCLLSGRHGVTLLAVGVLCHPVRQKFTLNNTKVLATNFTQHVIMYNAYGCDSWQSVEMINAWFDSNTFCIHFIITSELACACSIAPLSMAYTESNTKHKGMVTITHVLVQLECKHAIKILQLVTSKYCNLIGDCRDTSTTLDCHQIPVLHSIHWV